MYFAGAGRALASAAPALTSAAETLAQLYHHVCAVNGTQPERLLLEHAGHQDGAYHTHVTYCSYSTTLVQSATIICMYRPELAVPELLFFKFICGRSWVTSNLSNILTILLNQVIIEVKSSYSSKISQLYL